MQKIIRLVCLVAVFAGLVVGVSVKPDLVWAAGETIEGSTEFSGLKNTQIPLDDIQIAGTGDPTVPVRLFVSNGSLSFGTTTGLSFDGPSSGSQVEFSGSLANVNTALASLLYTRSTIGTDTLEISLVESGEVFFSDNGHLYEYVAVPGNTTWTAAETAAEGREKYGASGYLVTVTSQEENDFVADRLEGAGWMGATDVAVEGSWRWASGPESTTQFWSGDGSGSAVGGQYANWNNDNLPNPGTGSEPNNSGSNEDCAQFLSGGTGMWNDLPCSFNLPGYVVEYGQSGDMPTVASQDITITTTAVPDDPTSLGDDDVTDGGWINDNTPTMNFGLIDEDNQDQLRYRIQIDTNSDFSSPVVDYQSGPKSQGSFNFFVGQAEGEGTSGVGAYNIGSEGQVLGDDHYYWRVKSIDDAGNESNYVAANSGSIAFGIDTTGPTTPGTPSTSSPTTDTTPTLSWAASSDEGSGLHATPYVVQWSQDPEFGGFITTSNASTSYTIYSALDDGTWYFRVRARDSLLNYGNYSANGSVVVDTAASSISTLSPADGASNVLRDQDLIVSFNEPVVKDSGTITIYRSSDDSQIEAIDVESAQVSVAGNTITINPSMSLDYETEYYVQISADAINDTAGNSFAGISNTTSWSFTTEGSDYDSDGVASTIENAAPNNGDANNDGIADAQQDNVASFIDPDTGKYVTLFVDDICSIQSVKIMHGGEIGGSQDTAFSYPAGLMDFKLSCDTNGATTNITQYYYDTSGDFIVRKYSPNTGYFNIDNATVGSQTIDGRDVTVASYQVTDGGALDIDGIVNGQIHDPAGLGQASNSGALVDTGTKISLSLVFAGCLLLSSVAVVSKLSKPTRSKL